MQGVIPQTRRKALIFLPRRKKNMCQFVLFALALHVVMTKGTSFSDRKVDLGPICQSMWNAAGDNLKIGKEIVIYKGSSNKYPLITVTELGKKKMQRRIYVKFKDLLNSYEADESKAGKPSEQEAFIDAVSVKGGPMEIAFKYIKDLGKISFQNLDQFKPILKKIWFDKCSKKGRGPNICGFKHTFVGEVRYDGPKKNMIVEGFHNWIHFVSEEMARKLSYFPPPSKFVHGPPALISANFEWRGAKKPDGSSFFIGTSPAFEMALYTACFFRSSPAFEMAFNDGCPLRSPECTCQINRERLRIIATNCNGYVGTAYPKL
ncbi:PREDICTED: poly(U)-specific endoribonuclease-like isoform X1 [Acropora digitifera]|uniref:poly(U)-specific endoribonuclease-like isoform X1 n=1 Tax=Acropora digitifera TaxID=70779 RepID=UPI00077A768A|nr:PREDICTED: poly(U)-specific endoribonuclease-like isoform X1 [Acropora digitifera]